MTSTTSQNQGQEDAVLTLAERIDEMALHTRFTLPLTRSGLKSQIKVERVHDGWATWGTGPKYSGLLISDAVEVAEAIFEVAA